MACTVTVLYCTDGRTVHDPGCKAGALDTQNLLKRSEMETVELTLIRRQERFIVRILVEWDKARHTMNSRTWSRCLGCSGKPGTGCGCIESRSTSGHTRSSAISRVESCGILEPSCTLSKEHMLRLNAMHAGFLAQKRQDCLHQFWLMW